MVYFATNFLFTYFVHLLK